MTRTITSLSCLLFALVAFGGICFAKGPLLHGTFTGKKADGSGELVAVRFVSVNTPGTNTRVGSCNIGEPCGRSAVQSGHCPQDPAGRCDYLSDIVITAVRYDSDGPYHWEADYAYVDGSGVPTPFFTVRAVDVQGQDGIAITLAQSGESFALTLPPVQSRSPQDADERLCGAVDQAP